MIRSWRVIALIALPIAVSGVLGGGGQSSATPTPASAPAPFECAPDDHECSDDAFVICSDLLNGYCPMSRIVGGVS